MGAAKRKNQIIRRRQKCKIFQNANREPLRQRTIRGSTRQPFDSSRQPAVTAVAERRVLGMFAAAPRDGFGLGDLHFLRREAGAFLCAVAKRLAFGLTTGATEISAG